MYFHQSLIKPFKLKIPIQILNHLAHDDKQRLIFRKHYLNIDYVAR